MKPFAWDSGKDAKLKRERGIGFEEIALAITRGGLLDLTEHAEPGRHAGQLVFVVRCRDYAYLVPFVEDENSLFLKTVIPSRKATRQYLKRGPENETEAGP